MISRACGNPVDRQLREKTTIAVNGGKMVKVTYP